MDTRVNDWELPSEDIARLPRPRAITAIVEGVIEEFGRTEGPKRVCSHILNLLVEHASDPDHISEAALWSNTLDAVCKRRRIRFDTTQATVSTLYAKCGERKAGRIIERGKKALLEFSENQKRMFEERIGPLSVVDAVHARGMSYHME